MSAGALAGLEPCVHCGFCLQHCPTFLQTGDEADSPRGRIYLMQRLARGDLAAQDRGLTMHLDRCLGCRACETPCPSGVVYGPALEYARHQIARERPVPLLARLLTSILGEPVLRTATFGLARLLRPVARMLGGPGRWRFPLAMLGATVPSHRVRARPAPLPGARGRAVVFEGCIQRELFGHVNDATRRTLAANGFSTVPMPGQGCCGALHAHAGLHDEAMRLARANVTAFAREPDTVIVVNAAGCGATMRAYGDALADDPLAGLAVDLAARIRDVSEVLAEAGPRPGGPLMLTVAYDPPCHLAHAQRVVEPPRDLLGAIPDLQLVEHAESDICCGSAGTYTLLQPDMSAGILARKITALTDARPDVVATGNPGCVMQIGAGLRVAGHRIPVVHPVELLDRSYAQAGYYSASTSDPSTA